MFFKIKAGTTSRSIPIRVQDSTSTTGALLSGLTAGSSGLTCKYRRQGQAVEQTVSLTATGVTLDTYTPGGFIPDTILAGHYELQIPNAALQTGATYVVIALSGAANMVPVAILIELDAVDYQVDAFGALKPTASGRTLDVTANGNAGIDLGNVDNPTASLALTNTTISVGQQVASVSGNVGGTVGSVVGNVGGNVVGSVGSVAGNVSGNVNGTVGSVIGNVGGNVNGSTASIAGVSFPANFGNLGIGLTGKITGVVTVDELGSQALSQQSLDESIAILVWEQLTTTTWPANSFGKHVLIGNSANRSVAVNVSNHIAANIHQLQPAVIDSTHFAAGAINANALASDAASEIATAVGTLQVLTRLDSMIESNGAGQFRFDAVAMSNAVGGGAGGTINISVEDQSITVV